jgi:condensin complex subunit 2
MSLLRNTDDNTINFQRASCTLDGCVKIWTSRVDSVGTDTGKLLSNLAQDGRGRDEDDDEEGEGGEGGGDGSQRTKKSRRGPATTLAKDAAQLRNKKPDLEFNVDPLFKKTCADFDEGGAQGLLMSHLALGVTEAGALRIVFDASDAQARATDEEEEDLQEPEDAVDLTHLRREYFPDLAVLDDKAIAPSLADFSFGRNAMFDDSAFHISVNAGIDSGDDEDDFDGPPPHAGGDVDMDGDAFAPAPPVEDFFAGDQAVDGGFDDVYDGGDMDDDGGRDEHGSEAGSFVAHAGEYAQGGDAGGGGGRPMPFDPRRQGQPFVVMADDAGGGVLDYFDRGFVKNWAGPEHWKLRKPIRKGSSLRAPA